MTPTTEVGTLRGAVAAWPTVAEGKLKKLGKAGSFEYATYRDVEYAITARPVTPEEISPGPGELLVTAEREEVVDGTRWGSTVHHRAFPVPTGTFDREAAKRRRREPTEHPARPTDVLAALPFLHRREPTRLVIGPETDPHVARLRTWTKAKPPAVIEVGGSEGVERSPGHYVEWLRSRGIELSVAKGRLLAISSKPIGLEERTLITEAEELLLGVLTGKPTPCSMCDAQATTIVVPRVPLCQRHASGELEADR